MKDKYLELKNSRSTNNKWKQGSGMGDEKSFWALAWRWRSWELSRMKFNQEKSEFRRLFPSKSLLFPPLPLTSFSGWDPIFPKVVGEVYFQTLFFIMGKLGKSWHWVQHFMEGSSPALPPSLSYLVPVLNHQHIPHPWCPTLPPPVFTISFSIFLFFHTCMHTSMYTYFSTFIRILFFLSMIKSTIRNYGD